MTDLIYQAREYRTITAMIKELEEEAEQLRRQMIAELEARQTDTLQVDYFTIRYTPYTASRIDTTAIKKELPEIAERYTVTTESRRFQVA